MNESSETRGSYSGWKGVGGSMLRYKWLTAAVVVEALGILAAIGSIPVWGFPIALMLSLTGMLSATGVFIVTIYFVVQYNRRPLNYVQLGEVRDMLLPYLPREMAQDSFAPKSELSEFVQDFRLYWEWRYQDSVLQFAWESRNLRGQAGQVLVAELEGFHHLARKVRFTLVPPPKEELGQPLGSPGKELPERFSQYGSIFTYPDAVVLLYRCADNKIRYLEVNSPWDKVLFDDNTAQPLIVSEGQTSNLPQLKKIDGGEDYRWEWVSS